MKKRLFALLSCAALAAASITGCSSQKPAESAAASAEATETTGAVQGSRRLEDRADHDGLHRPALGNLK